MLNLNALGCLMVYFNHNLGKPGITQEKHDKWAEEIRNSPEGRFANCFCAEDVIRELNRPSR